MAEIRVYPSLIRASSGRPVAPLETHHVVGGTLHDWLLAEVPGYAGADHHPLVVEVDGRDAPPSEWPALDMTAGRVVDMRIIPRGGGGLLVGAIVAAVVAVGAAMLLRPSVPSASGRGSTQGSQLQAPEGQANVPKLGEPVPEIAGRHIVYPDYLSPPRRYFTDPKNQSLDIMLCVGAGSYDISNLRIGQTPIDGLAVDHQTFEPGQSVTGHGAHRHWYVAPEVGGASGNAGLHLQSTRDLDQVWDADLTLNGDTIEGDDQPSGWTAGTLINVEFTIPVVVTSGAGGINNFQMDIGYLAPTEEVTLRIEGISHLNEWPQPRIRSIDGNTYTLERISPVSGEYVAVGNISSGTYTAEVYRWNDEAQSFRITDASDGVIVVPRQGGSDVTSWSGFPAGANALAASIDQGYLTGIWSNAFLACPPGKTTQRIEWDVFAPRGLGYVNDNGNVESRTRTIEMRYRPEGGGAWTTVSRTISAGTRDQLGWTWSINLPNAMRPEVQVRRTNSESNSTQAMDRLEWYGLKAELTAATSYPGATTIAMTIGGSNEVAAQSENRINLIAHRRLPRLSGGTGPTRSISDWMRHVAHSVGYSDADIDVDELTRLDSLWTSRGDWFDYVHDDDDTVKEVLARALRAGMAELTIDDGLLSPIRDEPRTQFEEMYTPQNMTDDGLTWAVRAFEPGEIDGVDVEYFDENSWGWETVECRLPGDQGFRAEKLRVEGVTDRTRAWRIGMRERRRQKYRRWTYSFSTELDALNSSYLSYCALADDIPGYAQSALVEGVEVDGPDVHLLSSEPLEWQTGKSHVVAWRRPDGTLAGPFPAQPGDDERHVIAQMDEVPVIDYRREPPHLLFGTTDEWSFPVLITSINPRGFESVSVDAVNYDERIYADDNGTPN